MLSPAWSPLKVTDRLLPSDLQTLSGGWRHPGSVYGSQEPHVAAPLEMRLVGPRKWVLNQQPHPRGRAPSYSAARKRASLDLGQVREHLCFFLRQLT